MSFEDNQRNLRVFLCHATEDKFKVHDLYSRLKEEGIDVWLDKENLLPGQDWQLEIPKAVQNSDIVIVCLSRHSVEKTGYVQKEIRLALDTADLQPEGTIYIIPAKLEECEVPSRLAKWQWVNLFDVTELGYERLLQSLRIRSASLRVNFSSTIKSDNTEAKRYTPITTERLSHPPMIKYGKLDIYVFANMEFIFIPPGKYWVGIQNEPYALDGREVEINTGYWIGRYPVTNQQFFAFTNETNYRHEWDKSVGKKLNHPVRNIIWDTAISYCRWLGNNFRSELPIGYIFRIPSEVEWEIAARGKYSSLYPWGNNFPPKDIERCNSKEAGYNDTTPVGYYSPEGDSSFGSADMAGNVWEWTRSTYDDNNPTLYHSTRILRGGSFESTGRFVSSYYRKKVDLTLLPSEAKLNKPIDQPNNQQIGLLRSRRPNLSESHYWIGEFGMRIAVCTYPE